MLEYYGNRSATLDCVDRNGWLATGDLAKCDEEGNYFIVDRKKDVIISGGYKIYPAEVERAICGHAAVAAVAVGRVPDAVKGEVAKAYVVLRPGATLQRDELIEFCRSRLAPYKIPRKVEFVASLPLTSTGKVKRRALERQEASALHANFDAEIRIKTRHIKTDTYD
jgi:long-chain acyl-CoA synthetase